MIQNSVLQPFLLAPPTDRQAHSFAQHFLAVRAVRCHLAKHHFVVTTARLHEFLVRPPLDDASLLHQ